MTTRGQVLELINQWPRIPFRYGSADCCQFAGWIAYKLHGIDALQAFDYNSEDGAREYINAAGGLTELLSKALGSDQIPSPELAPGDPVLFQHSKYPEAVAVKLSDRLAAGLNHRGRVIELPLSWCPYGWRLWPE